jgi:hypothetical protein
LGDNGDAGADREGPKLALEALVIAVLLEHLPTIYAPSSLTFSP